MKKLILLVAWFFLGQLSLEEWKTLDSNLFLNAVAEVFSEQNQCNSEVVAMTDGKDVVIFGRCQEIKKQSM